MNTLITRTGERARRRVAAVLAVILGAATSATLLPTSAAAAVSAPTITRALDIGPVANHQAPAPGYVEEEFFVEGNAHYYTADPSTLGGDGKWTTTPSEVTAPYKVRILVRRPAHARRFNGTVLLEWLNVSAGTEGAPDWTLTSEEIWRTGGAWVGAGVQWVGVENPNPPIFVGAPPALKQFNPARYGTLQHPGDAYSYDIFSQVAQALRTPNGPDPLGDLRLRTIIGDGESQSAGRLATYINGVHPHARVYDGFLVHSRGAAATALSQTLNAGPGSGTAVNAPPQVPGPNPMTIRDDLDEPVLSFQAETDVGVLGGWRARRDDDARFRLWEVAGTAHGDAYMLGSPDPRALITGPAPLPDFCGPVGTTVPINAGPQTFGMRAALRHLRAWIENGTAPPSGARIAVDANGVIRRDPATGLALGGIRYADVDVPTRTLTGERGPGGSPFCGLMGRTDPWNGDSDAWDGTAADPSPTPEPDLAVLYPSHGVYVCKVVRATNGSIRAGFLLRDDRRSFVDVAAQSDIGRAAS